MGDMKSANSKMSSPSYDYSCPGMRHEGETDATTTGSGGEEVESPPRSDVAHPQPAPSNIDKPPHSYIALISMAILSSPDRRLILGDIYENIQKRFAYYGSMREKAWRNSIRHNLSLNECFVKCGRAENGKGHYWRVHPACVADFIQGNYCRRQARRRARRASHCSPPTTVRSIASRFDSGYVPMTQMTTGTTPYQSMHTTSYPSVMSNYLPYRFHHSPVLSLTSQALNPMPTNVQLKMEESAHMPADVSGFRGTFPLTMSLPNHNVSIEHYSDRRFASLQ